MTQSLDRVGDSVEKVLSDAVVDERESGTIKANRRIFTDEEIFEPPATSWSAARAFAA